ncbi:MAG: hypothetical protein JXA49_06690 [Actinobacteria bacterium]|nr:hypothetical protein [Actinomycetota bacterium]
MACDCPECSKHSGPNKMVMMFKIGVFFLQYIYATFAMIRKGKFKELGALIGAFVFFFTIPRRMICARCDQYGNNCYSLYLGKVTSWIHPKVEGKQVNNLGIALELLALGSMSAIPAWALKWHFKALMPYMLLLDTTVFMQFIHACRHCGLYATDWRKDCPAAQIARVFFEK